MSVQYHSSLYLTAEAPVCCWSRMNEASIDEEIEAVRIERGSENCTSLWASYPRRLHRADGKVSSRLLFKDL